MIERFGSFLLENSNKQLLYYAFDWDDNILNMPTFIHMDKLVNNQWIPTDISTSEFAQVREDKENWRVRNGDPEEGFCEFRDGGPRGSNAFREDVEKAISLNRYGPAWVDFMECITNGSVFAIITARGHEPQTIRSAVEWIIDNVLTDDQVYEMYNNLKKFDYLFGSEIESERILKGNPSQNKLVQTYLNNCDFVGVSAPSRGTNFFGPEKAKEEALLDFKSKINKFASKIGYKAIVGFSDDDVKNVKHIEDLIDNLNHERFPNIVKYIVKGTKDPNNITKKVRTISESNQSQGLEGSIIPFSKFGSIASKFFPSNDMGDPVAVSHNLLTNHIEDNINKPLRKSIHRRRNKKKK
jgi:hypothetical protein